MLATLQEYPRLASAVGVVVCIVLAVLYMAVNKLIDGLAMLHTSRDLAHALVMSHSISVAALIHFVLDMQQINKLKRELREAREELEQQALGVGLQHTENARLRQQLRAARATFWSRVRFVLAARGVVELVVDVHFVQEEHVAVVAHLRHCLRHVP
eukprot:2553216-Rhodomonas_salina.1